MRILIAIGVRRIKEAGAAGVAFNHAEELEKLGHQVELWFSDDLLHPPRWPARFQELEFAAVVSRRIRSNPSQFDVVNIHAPWGCVYGCSRKLLPSAKLPPYVFTMQGSEERYTLAMRFEHRKGRARNFALKNRIWHRAYHQTMYNLSISTADFGAVANREGWLLSELKYGHPSGRIWYVPNGTNPDFFRPRVFSDSPARRLLFVGTWLDRKGIYYLADSFAELALRLPDITLTIVGCSFSEEVVELLTRAASRSYFRVSCFEPQRDAGRVRLARYFRFSVARGRHAASVAGSDGDLHAGCHHQRVWHGRRGGKRVQRLARAGGRFRRPHGRRSTPLRRCGIAETIGSSRARNRAPVYLAGHRRADGTHFQTGRAGAKCPFAVKPVSVCNTGCKMVRPYQMMIGVEFSVHEVAHPICSSATGFAGRSFLAELQAGPSIFCMDRSAASHSPAHSSGTPSIDALFPFSSDGRRNWGGGRRFRGRFARGYAFRWNALSYRSVHLSRIPALNFVKRAAHRTVQAAGTGSTVWIEAFSRDAVRNWDLPIDFLLIDGDHREEAVEQDWKDWYPSLLRTVLPHSTMRGSFRPGGQHRTTVQCYS